MNNEEVLNTFLLANIPEIIMQEEFDDVKKAIKELQQENKKYKEAIDKLKEWINIVQQNKDNKHLEPFISTDELDELLDILKGSGIND